MKIAQSFYRRARLCSGRARALRNVPATLAGSASRLSPQKIGFPNCASRQFSAVSDLISILSREEKEEVDTGNTQMPQELADLKSNLEANWRIVEDGGNINLFLKDRKVHVSFHCQDTFEEAVEEEEQEEEPIDAIRFTVTVSKAGKTLVYSCISEYGEAKIDGVSTTTSEPDVVHASHGALEKKEYQGPDFYELAEDLQDAFGAYLEDECAVDSDLAAFVAMYADYKEQMSYVQFLKDAQSIIS